MTANLLMINRHTKEMIGEIRDADPDILFLQEYAPHWHEALSEALGANYPYTCGVQREDSFGAAIYSKHSFVGKPERYLPMGTSGVPEIRAVVDVGGTHVAAYNIHLLPPRRLDYTREQRLQFADLLGHLEAEKLPFVMCGDFNFTYTSAFAASLRGMGLSDAHARAGRGRGVTWPGNLFLRWLPGLRFDQVWTSGDMECVACRTGTGTGSDHRPVIARIAVAE
jgi:endonuclease/exonuclease/phosphatase (EEP) superfamily protein YafD